MIDACYVNAIIEGYSKTSVSGFVLQGEMGNTGNIDNITNCFVTGAIYSGGDAYGFSGALHTNFVIMSNNYTAMYEMRGTNYYLFARGQGSFKKDQYVQYLGVNKRYISGSSQKSVGESATYSELQGSGEVITYKYNSNHGNVDTQVAAYPLRFKINSNAYLTPQFWGDFPKK